MFLASDMVYSVIDVVALCTIILFTLIGLRRGAVNRIVGMVGGVLSLIFALCFCKSFANLIDGWVGWQDKICAPIQRGLAKKSAFNVTVESAEELASKLSTLPLPKFIKRTLLKIQSFPPDTTIAMLVADKLAGYVTITVSYIILYIALRLVLLLLKFIFARLEQTNFVILLANKVLGFAFGFLQGIFIIAFILYIIDVIPFLDYLQGVIKQTHMLKFMTKYNFFAQIFYWILQM